jgi:hypothetical protein
MENTLKGEKVLKSRISRLIIEPREKKTLDPLFLS